MSPQTESTLDELLADPLVVALMRADGVDPVRLRADLQLAAGAARTRRHAAHFSQKSISLGLPAAICGRVRRDAAGCLPQW